MMPKTVVRRFHPDDAHELWQLFFDTVHTVNLRDYSQEQVDAWAPRDADPQAWATGLQTSTTFVAERERMLVGFAEFQPHAAVSSPAAPSPAAPSPVDAGRRDAGHIDRFYCHADWLGQGIGTLLLGHLESHAWRLGVRELRLEASITSRPFFERRGFVVSKQQQVERRGVWFTNFAMTKRLEPADATE